MERLRFDRRTILSAALSTALVVACATVIAGPALAESGKFVDGKLQPLEDGFPNKPIVLMVVDEPGSTDSVYATQLAETASKMSPVPVKIEHRMDFSNFGTWEALAWVENQGDLGKQGYITFVYTQPGAVIDLLAVDIKSATGVDLKDLNGIIATEQIPFMLHQRADAPWGDKLEDLVKYAKENPNTVRHITGGPGGGQDAAMQVWIRKLGFTVKDIIGGGPGERALVVAAGEGDVTVSPVDVLLPHYEAGRVNVLMSAGKNPVPEPWTDAPNAQELGMENDPFDQTRAIAVAPSVPDSHLKWLHDLFAAASEDEDYLAKRKKIPGLTPVLLEHDDVAKLAQNAYDLTLPVFKEMGVYWGDKKK